MRPMARTALIFILALCFCACGRQVENAPPANSLHVKKEVPEKLERAITAIEPFFKPMGTPASIDWLASHNEPGQTFEEYINEDPTLPTAERQRLYVLPLGRFNA